MFEGWRVGRKHPLGAGASAGAARELAEVHARCAWRGRGREVTSEAAAAHDSAAMRRRLSAKVLDKRRKTTQAIGQQHTSPLRAGCEARRREIVLIFGCGNGLARDGPGASKAYGGLRAGGPQGL